MTSRHFFRTFRRLLFSSSFYIPLSFRKNPVFWTSLGTGTVLSTTIYNLLPVEHYNRLFIVHAKTIEKDLSPTGIELVSSALVTLI